MDDSLAIVSFKYENERNNWKKYFSFYDPKMFPKKKREKKRKKRVYNKLNSLIALTISI